ncbi:MAG: type II toxin-antitoxin system PemK/MazF family toxin [Candidatus Promineifilaceae bacterium]
MRRGDVYDARIDHDQGIQQAGVEPVVIVSRDAINFYSSILVVVPVIVAGSQNHNFPNQVPLRRGEGGLEVDSIAVAGQLFAMPKENLLQQRGTLPAERMAALDQALRVTLDL